jgi:hypothetical protein
MKNMCSCIFHRSNRPPNGRNGRGVCSCIFNPTAHLTGVTVAQGAYIKYEKKVGKTKTKGGQTSILQGLNILVGFQDILRGFGRILEDLGDNFEEYLHNP